MGRRPGLFFSPGAERLAAGSCLLFEPWCGLWVIAFQPACPAALAERINLHNKMRRKVPNWVHCPESRRQKKWRDRCGRGRRSRAGDGRRGWKAYGDGRGAQRQSGARRWRAPRATVAPTRGRSPGRRRDSRDPGNQQCSCTKPACVLGPFVVPAYPAATENIALVEMN